MSYHSLFHTTCLLKPISESFLGLIAENPSVFWFCPACIGCKTSCESGTDMEHAGGNNDDNMGADVMMQNTLMTFKRDILKLVGETMENKLKSFSDLINQQSCTC